LHLKFPSPNFKNVPIFSLIKTEYLKKPNENFIFLNTFSQFGLNYLNLSSFDYFINKMDIWTYYNLIYIYKKYVNYYNSIWYDKDNTKYIKINFDESILNNLKYIVSLAIFIMYSNKYAIRFPTLYQEFKNSKDKNVLIIPEALENNEEIYKKINKNKIGITLNKLFYYDNIIYKKKKISSKIKSKIQSDNLNEKTVKYYINKASILNNKVPILNKSFSKEDILRESSILKNMFLDLFKNLFIYS